MDYITQMLEDLDNGSQLVIECKRSDSGISFEAYVIDAKRRGYFSTEQSTVDLVMGRIDALAEEWLSEQP